MPIDPILIDIPAELRGERVLVRPYRAGDGVAVNEAVLESYLHLAPWMPWASPDSTDEGYELYSRRCAAKFIIREDMPMGMWDINGRYLGGTGLHRIDWEIRRFEIGYWVRVSEAGRGYVTESARLLCELAFGLLEANRVLIRCATDNSRSEAIPRRLGFEHEGVLKNDGMGPDRVACDMNIFGMTRAAWMARNG